MTAKLILLIEDNPDDVALTQRAFEKNNVQAKIVVARDGVEALDFLFGHAGAPGHTNGRTLPSLILLDLKLPKVDGLQVLERLRSDTRTKLIPVVILTSSKEERDVTSGYRLGANSYIRKPVDFEKFVETVKQLGSYWLTLNEPPAP